MFKKLIIPFVLTFFVIPFLWSQTVIDSIKQKYNDEKDVTEKGFYALDLCFHYSRRSIDSAELYLEIADSIFSVVGNETGKNRIFYQRGLLEKNKGNFSYSKNQFLEYLHRSEEKQDSLQIAFVLDQLAVVSMNQGTFDQAMNYQSRAISIYESRLDWDKYLGSSFNILGQVHKNLKNYNLAEEYYGKYKEKSSQYSNLDGIATGAVNLGNLYSLLKRYDHAIAEYEEAIYYDSLANFSWGLAYDFENLGNIYLQKEEFDRAESYLLKSAELREKFGSKYEKAISYEKLAGLYVETKSNEALDYLTKAYQLAKEIDAKVILKNIEMHYVKHYEQNDLFKKAFYHQKKVNILNDSIFQQNNADKINELEKQYETSQKEKEIAFLNSKNEVALLKLEASNRRNIALGIGMGIIGLFLFFLYRLYQRIQAQNKIITKTLDEKDILLREIHHRVKNNLQFVSSLLNLQSRHVEDDTAQKALQEGQNRVKSMALIHQNLYQEENLTGIHISEYLEKLTSSLFHSYNISPDRIKLKMDIQNVNLDVDTVIPLGLVINELISNSLKHAFPDSMEGSITVLLKEENEELLLSIKDDGIGLENSDEEQLKKSFGYRLINAFKSQLDAELEINGTNGTSVNMRVRDYKKVA